MLLLILIPSIGIMRQIEGVLLGRDRFDGELGQGVCKDLKFRILVPFVKAARWVKEAK